MAADRRRPNADTVVGMVPGPEFPAGPFTPTLLRDLGISRRALRSALDSDEVRRVIRGVYVRSDTADTIELRAGAAALVVNDRAVFCDRTAAWIHGIDVFAWHELEVLPALETFALRHHPAPRRAGVAGGSRDLLPDDVMRVGPVSVTTPLRTAVDLACILSPRDGLAALDAFMRKFGLTHAELKRLLVRYFRRRGVRRARALVSMADARSESPGESWIRFEVLVRGITAPQPQYWIEVDGIPTYRLDLAYPRHRIAVEYDGQEHHTSPEDRDRDRRRREWLGDNGWIVIVVDKNALTAERVDEWILELRAALRSRDYSARRHI